MDRQAPRLLALFQKRIEGDDALLRLAQARFREAGLGAEFYAEKPDELQWLLGFRPSSDLPVTVHLSRGINLLSDDSRFLIAEFSRRFAHDVYGLVIHDQGAAASDLEGYLAAVNETARLLKDGPLLFIEYAVGLDPDRYLEIFRRLRDLESVSACIDTGHVGLRQVRRRYSEIGGEDPFSLTPSDHCLSDAVDDLEEAVQSALPVLLGLIKGTGELNKPVHFHLHDGHPLYKGAYGVSDHMSFFSEIPIPFEHKGRMILPPMYGPSGLREIVKTSLAVLDPGLLSFSLEIHPPEGQEPLGEKESLSQHWQDRSNAERMNHWISVLLRNQQLLLDACRD
ncbi:MAG: hypothetical protein WC291_07640 [Thermodesulfovibrionales bacterium]|jgi:hypothetical protein